VRGGSADPGHRPATDAAAPLGSAVVDLAAGPNASLRPPSVEPEAEAEPEAPAVPLTIQFSDGQEDMYALVTTAPLSGLALYAAISREGTRARLALPDGTEIDQSRSAEDYDLGPSSIVIAIIDDEDFDAAVASAGKPSAPSKDDMWVGSGLVCFFFFFFFFCFVSNPPLVPSPQRKGSARGQHCGQAAVFRPHEPRVCDCADRALFRPGGADRGPAVGARRRGDPQV
jgi:hypothetical protein